MPRVDFYILKSAENNMLCRIIEKAYKQGHKIYILTENPEKSAVLDKLLWTYSDTSFIPHQILQESYDPVVPIYISHNLSPTLEIYDILLNLSEKTPDFFEKFSRIIEVVSDQPETKQKSREKYRYYRDKQCELHSHSL